GFCVRAHSAACSAPRAKITRSSALCVSSSRSAAPAKITLCSPTTVPPRSVEKPISPVFRAPVWPSRLLTARLSSSMPRPSAAARPSSSAVPDGASTFWLWCISTISMSNEASSVLATRRTSAASRLTPRLMLPDFTITAFLAASLMRASSSALKPVVPMMWVLPCLAHSSANATVAAGAVKSMTPSILSMSEAGSLASLMLFSLMPASVPESQPIKGERASSSAPASVMPLLSAIALTSVRPIRPPAPATASRMSAMDRSPEHRGGIAGRPVACHPFRPFRSRQRRTTRNDLGLRAVVALDHDQVGLGRGLPHRDQPGVFRRAVAVERGLVGRKFQHHDPAAAFAFDDFGLAAARHIAAAELAQHIRQALRVFRIAVRFADVDLCDPVAFSHDSFSLLLGVRDVCDDLLGGQFRIGRFNHRPPDHQIIRTRRDCLGRRHDAL